MKSEQKEADTVPRALREVWEWKDAIWREVEHLPTREAVHEVLARAQKTAEELGFHDADAGTTTPGHAVAEGRAQYGKKEQGSKEGQP